MAIRKEKKNNNKQKINVYAHYIDYKPCYNKPLEAVQRTPESEELLDPLALVVGIHGSALHGVVSA